MTLFFLFKILQFTIKNLGKAHFETKFIWFE